MQKWKIGDMQTLINILTVMIKILIKLLQIRK